MPPTDILDPVLTPYRDGAVAILSATAGVLGRVSSARLYTDLEGIVVPYAVSEQVRPGPAMPPADKTPDPVTGLPKPTWGTALGECKKFDHPDKLLAAVAAFQHLQGALGEEMTFTNSEGQPVTMYAGAALTALL